MQAPEDLNGFLRILARSKHVIGASLHSCLREVVQSLLTILPDVVEMVLQALGHLLVVLRLRAHITDLPLANLHRLLELRLQRQRHHSRSDEVLHELLLLEENPLLGSIEVRAPLRHFSSLLHFPRRSILTRGGQFSKVPFKAHDDSSFAICVRAVFGDVVLARPAHPLVASVASVLSLAAFVSCLHLVLEGSQKISTRVGQGSEVLMQAPEDLNGFLRILARSKHVIGASLHSCLREVVQSLLTILPDVVEMVLQALGHLLVVLRLRAHITDLPLANLHRLLELRLQRQRHHSRSDEVLHELLLLEENPLLGSIEVRAPLRHFSSLLHFPRRSILTRGGQFFKVLFKAHDDSSFAICVRAVFGDVLLARPAHPLVASVPSLAACFHWLHLVLEGTQEISTRGGQGEEVLMQAPEDLNGFL